MTANKKILICILLQLGLVSAVVVKFTNLKCFALDPAFATFDICQLKLIKRGVAALTVHTKLHKVPVDNCTVNGALYKKFSGYRPFLYNMTVDFCKTMKIASRKLSVLTILYDMVWKYSNINHTCPYNHDIIVKNLTLDGAMFKYLPLPEGDYMIKFIVGAYNDWKANVQVYFSFY